MKKATVSESGVELDIFTRGGMEMIKTFSFFQFFLSVQKKIVKLPGFANSRWPPQLDPNSFN